MDNNPKILPGDNIQEGRYLEKKAEEKAEIKDLLSKVRPFGKGAVDAFSIKEGPKQKLPYSKTPEEYESEINDLATQRENFMTALELSTMRDSYINELQNLKSEDVPLAPHQRIQRTNRISELEGTLQNVEFEMSKLLKVPFEPKQTKTEWLTSAFKDAYNVWSEILATGDIWSSKTPETEQARLRMKDRSLALIKGFNNIFGSSLEGIAIIGNAYDRFIQDKLGLPQTRLEDSPVFKLGHWLTKTSQPFTKDTDITYDVMNAMGSMLGFIMGGEFLAPLKSFKVGGDLLEKIFSRSGRVALTGGMAQFPDEYLKALQLGASQTQAAMIGAANFIGGMTEALPLERLFVRLGLPRLGWRDLFITASKQGGEEALQEMLQQFISNASAKTIYDVNRDLYEGIGHGGIIGFMSGFLTMGLGSVAKTSQMYKDDANFKKAVDESLSKAYQYAQEVANTEVLTKIEQVKPLLGQRDILLPEEQQKIIDTLNESIKSTDKVYKQKLLNDVIENEDFEFLFDPEFDKQLELPTKEDIENASPQELTDYANTLIKAHNDYMERLRTEGVKLDAESDGTLESERLIEPVAENISIDIAQKIGLPQVAYFVRQPVKLRLQGLYSDAKNELFSTIYTEKFAEHFGLEFKSDAFEKFVSDIDKELSTIKGNPDFILSEAVKYSESPMLFSESTEQEPTSRFIRYDKIITRDLVKSRPKVLFLFGDNLTRKGLGGQAKEMRGEPNTIGIVTKKYPSMDELAFMTDKEFDENAAQITRDINKAIEKWKTGQYDKVVAPPMGVGLAKLQERAPLTWNHLQEELNRFEAVVNSVPNLTESIFSKSGSSMLQDVLEKLPESHTKELIKDYNKILPGEVIDFGEVTDEQGNVYTNKLGAFSIYSGKITVRHDIPLDKQVETIGHEITHKLTLHGIIDSYSKLHNPKLYDKEFRKKIKDLYDFLVKGNHIKVGSHSEMLDSEGNVILSKEDVELSEFIAKGMTDTDVQTYLAGIYYKNTGRSAWRTFINAIVEFLNKVGVKIQESALSELIQLTTNYIDTHYSDKSVETITAFHGSVKVPLSYVKGKGFVPTIQQGTFMSSSQGWVSYYWNTFKQHEKMESLIKANLFPKKVYNASSIVEVDSKEKQDALKSQGYDLVVFDRNDEFGQTKEYVILDPSIVQIIDDKGTDLSNVTQRITYKGGFDSKGKGTPEGDGKDKAMRQVATTSIVELGKQTPSSSKTTQEMLPWDTNKTINGVVMLARNGILSEQPLDPRTIKHIDEAFERGATFVVGDMPNVDTQFMDYLDKIGASYTIYHTGNTSRVIRNELSETQVEQERVVSENISDLSSPVEIMPNYKESIPPKNEVDKKDESDSTENEYKKLLSTQSIGSLVESFVDKDGNRIYQSAQDAVAEAEYLRTLPEEEAYQKFKEKYKDRISDEQNNEVIQDKLADYLDYFYFNIKNKSNHTVVTIDHAKKQISTVTGNYINSTGGTSSTIYNKMMFESILEDVNKALNSKIVMYEIKRVDKDALKENTMLLEDMVPLLYKNGYIYFRNKTEEFAVEISSLPQQVLERASSIKSTDERIGNAEILATAFSNLYWETVLLSDSVKVKLKRSGLVSDANANTLITSYVRTLIPTDKTSYFYIDENNNIQVKKAILDTDSLPSNLKSHLEKIYEGNYKDGILGDGVIIDLEEVHDVHNLINMNSWEKWGGMNKFKTIDKDKNMLKCASMKGFNWMPIVKWMRFNNIGRLVLTSSQKIRVGEQADSKNWVTIDEILSEEKTPISKSKVFLHNMREDTDISSHGEVKKSVKGITPSYFTTMITHYMKEDELKGLREHLKSHYTSLNNNILSKLNDVNYLSQEIMDFMKRNDDLFESHTQKFIERELQQSSEFALIPTVIDYYKQNILNRKLQDTLSHKDPGGSYPALIPDMGPLTGYKEYFMTVNKITNPDDKRVTEYFDELGFMNKNLAITDKQVSKGHDIGSQMIVACNPPAGMQDLRALNLILKLPTRVKTHKPYDKEVKTVTGLNIIVVNSPQFQGMSGKDFDIDKIPIIWADNENKKTIWNFIRRQNTDDTIKEMLDAFQDYTADSDATVTASNDIKEVSKLVNMPVDNALMHVIKLFGVNDQLVGFNLNKPEDLFMTYKMFQSSFIGKLYDIKLAYSLILERGSLSYTTEKGALVTIAPNEKKERNIALLYYLTNYTLDWTSDLKLLTFNYDAEKIIPLLYDITVNKKPADKKYHVGIYKKMYKNLIKSTRLLLKGEDTNSTYQQFVALRRLMVSAAKTHQSIRPSLLGDSYADFLEIYKNSNASTITLTPLEIRQIEQSLFNLIGSEEEQMSISMSYVEPIARLMNRYISVGKSAPRMWLDTKAKDKLLSNENSLSTLTEIIHIGKEYDAFKNLFPDLIRSMFKNGVVFTLKDINNKTVTFNTPYNKIAGSQFTMNYLDNKWTFKKDSYNYNQSGIKTVISSKNYETFEDMWNDSQSEYTIQSAMTSLNADGTSPVVEQLTKIIMFRDNSALTSLLSNQMYDLYKLAAEVVKQYDVADQKLFFKLALGIYDYTSDEDPTRFKERWALAIKDKYKTVESDSVKDNLEYINKMPALNYIHAVSDVNIEALNLYRDFTKKWIQESRVIWDNKVGRQPMLLFNSAATPEEIIPFKDKPVTFKTYETQINNLTQKILNISELDNIQIATFWNMFSDSIPILPEEVKDKHKVFWARNYAESFFNYKVSFEKIRTSNSYNAELEALNSLSDRELSNNLKDYNWASQMVGKFMPAQTVYRRYSNRERHTYAPNERVVYSIGGVQKSPLVASIIAEYGEFEPLDKPGLKLSGSMVAQKILRDINDYYNDEHNKLRIFVNDTYTKIFNDANEMLEYQQSSNDVFDGFGAKIIMSEMAEGIDKHKALTGMTVLEESGKINFNGIEYTIIDYLGNVDMKILTALSQDILVKNKLYDVNDEVHNKDARKFYNAFQTRAIMGAVFTRYLLDYKAKQIIENHISNLNNLFTHVKPFLSKDYRTLMSQYLFSHNGILGKSYKMLAQIDTMKRKMKDKGKFYFPHVFRSDELKEEGIYDFFYTKYHPDFMAGKLTLEQFKKKIKDDTAKYSKLEREQESIGVPKTMSHLNFWHRTDLDLTKGYEKDESVIETYFQVLNLQTRSHFIDANNALFEQLISDEVEFIKHYWRSMLGAVKTNDAIYKPAEIKQLNKRQFVKFVDTFRDKVIIGEVEFTDRKENSFYIVGEIDEVTGEPMKFTSLNVKDLNLLTGTVSWKKAQLYMYKTLGLETKSGGLKWAYWLAEKKIKLTNYSLLQTSLVFPLRNLYGSRINRFNLLGTGYFKELKKILLLVKMTDPPLTTSQRAIYDLIKSESTSLFGNINELLSNEVSGTGNELTEQTRQRQSETALRKKIREQWKTDRAELQELLYKINESPEKAGFEKTNVDYLGKFLGKLATMDYLKDLVFNRMNLYAFPAGLIFPNINEFKTAYVESINRLSTPMALYTMLADSFELERLTPSEQQEISPYMTEMLISIMKGFTVFSEGLYQKGLDRSYYENHALLGAMLQYSHFSNNLINNNFLSKVYQSSQWIKRHGALKIFKRHQYYEFHYRNYITGEVITKQIKELNPVKQAASQVLSSMTLGLVALIVRWTGKLFLSAALVGTIKQFLDALLFKPLGDSLIIAPINTLIPYFVALLTEVNTIPDDDEYKDDEGMAVFKKVSKYKQFMYELLPYDVTYEEFKAETIRRFESETSPYFASKLNEEDIRFRYEVTRMKLNSEAYMNWFSYLPGVGFDSIFTILSSWVVSQSMLNSENEEQVINALETIIPFLKQARIGSELLTNALGVEDIFPGRDNLDTEMNKLRIEHRNVVEETRQKTFEFKQTQDEAGIYYKDSTETKDPYEKLKKLNEEIDRIKRGELLNEEYLRQKMLAEGYPPISVEKERTEEYSKKFMITSALEKMGFDKQSIDKIVNAETSKIGINLFNKYDELKDQGKHVEARVILELIDNLVKDVKPKP